MAPRRRHGNAAAPPPWRCTPQCRGSAVAAPWWRHGGAAAAPPRSHPSNRALVCRPVVCFIFVSVCVVFVSSFVVFFLFFGFRCVRYRLMSCAVCFHERLVGVLVCVVPCCSPLSGDGGARSLILSPPPFSPSALLPSAAPNSTVIPPA